MNKPSNTNLAPPAQENAPSALVSLASRYNVDPAKLFTTIKQTLARQASNEELMAFSIVCDQYKLNPFVREIYAFPAKNGGIVPMVSIDGWLKIINSHPLFDGMEIHLSQDFSACTVTVYKKGNSHPTVITEYLQECERPTDPWRKSPRRMLRHKAIIQAGRVAFGFSGIYDEDEGKDAEGFMPPPPEHGERNVTPPIDPEAIPEGAFIIDGEAIGNPADSIEKDANDYVRDEYNKDNDPEIFF